VLARVLLVATSLLLVGAVLAAYTWRAVFDSDQFANRATAALQDPSVRQAVGDRVTDDLLLRAEPDLLAARPIVASAVAGIVGGDAFAALFRRAASDAHRAVFRRDSDTVVLTLADVGVIAAEALRRLRPELAAQLQADRRVQLLGRDLGGFTGDLARLARRVRALAYVLALLTVACAVAAVAVSPERRRACVRLGVAVIAAGVAIVAAAVVAKALVLATVDGADDDAAGAVWDAFAGDLRTAGWLIAGAGAVLGAAAASLIRPVDVDAPLRAAWRLATTEPERKRWRVARGVALIVIGALVIAEPSQMLVIAATVVGVYVLYRGLEALLRVLAPPLERATARPPRRVRLRLLAVPVAAAAMIAAATAAYAGSDAADEAPPDVDRCNGHRALCDRRLDEVVLPATHNAMSVPLPGWFAALQEHPIAQQLDDGIRGLLIDTHYADLLSNGRTRTDFVREGGIGAAIEQDAVSPASVAAAKRLRERLGFRGAGKPGMYLCHTFCELGSTPLGDVLEDIRDFLVTHPAEVLVVINQDYVTPEDFTGAVEDAGLADYAFTPPGDGAWPTLRELIERDRRLVVLAENRAGAASWYQPAFERLTQDTPFTFERPALLTEPDDLAASCAPNRGPSGAPLFLVNHWINTDPTPRPSNAAIVNARGPLLRRARACEADRGRPVNLLAVDFYTRGDLFEVVDELNASRR
jgi:uncharacterized membrane protein HdeD (DUF308 family)